MHVKVLMALATIWEVGGGGQGGEDCVQKIRWAACKSYDSIAWNSPIGSRSLWFAYFSEHIKKGNAQGALLYVTPFDVLLQARLVSLKR